MKQKISLFFLMIAFAFVPAISFAQDPEDPCTAPEDPCPIDSGVVLLMAAVVGIAAKKTYDYRNAVQPI
jgi:hypothetical protein